MNDSMISRNYTTQDNSSQESGWTLYLEDFMANKNGQQQQQHNINDNKYYSLSGCSDYQNSSMISDAGFRKVGNRKLVSRNRKIFTSNQVLFVDDELEDTASSPCHSLKVNDLNQLYMKSKELSTQDVHQHEKGQTPQHNAGEGNNNMSNLNTQMRRKGLCLVPMSMLINNNHLT